MGCGASVATDKSVVNSTTPVNISSPTHPHRSQVSITNGEKGQQRVQAKDLVQNYFLLWLDSNLDESNEDFRNSIKQLQLTVDTIEKFRNADECFNYISSFKNQKAFLIVSGALTENVVPRVHRMSQIYAIYIFCRKKSKYEQWKTEEWPKVRGVFTEIHSICASVQQSARECDDDTVGITGELESSFMYTTFFKEIVLEIDFDEKKTIPELADYACQQKVYANNKKELELINKFAQEYYGNIDNNPVQWYTAECFTYKMLNKALGNLDVTTLLKTGFFMRDLHQNIQQLHDEQLNDKDKPFPSIVYRGQTMTQQDFEIKIQPNKLMSYNNFLSTSEERYVAADFIRRKLRSDNTKIGVLFIITIDPSIKSVPYARIAKFSKFPNELEILFSTHTVFRIRQIKEIQQEEMKIWQVKLTLTSDDVNEELSALTNQIRTEITGTGWQRMGLLLWKMGENNKAEQVFTMLLEQAPDDVNNQAYCYNQLGLMKDNQGQYNAAIDFYEKSHKIKEKTLPLNHPNLATSYNNIGAVYDNMGDYSKALEFYEKALKIREKALPPNHPDLATSYNNIGAVYYHMGDYSKALEFYEKALKIRENALPPNHPDLATSYNNIGLVYNNMGDYSNALEFYEKALKIEEKTLPSNHPDLATSYNNIASVYDNMGDYSKALEFYEKSNKIFEKALPSNHPDLATSYNNIGLVYDNMGDYSKALEFYEKALKIREKALPPNHPDLATSYSNIGLVYDNMDDYSKALEFHEKALKIREKALPPNHPDLATSYNNIGLVYNNMDDYSEALEFYEKALKIREKALPPNHPDLATSYNNIGAVYYHMGDYSKALQYFKKTHQIFENALPPNHRHLAFPYNWFGKIYRSMKDYPKALDNFEKCLAIWKKALRDNHPYLALTYSNIGDVHRLMGNYEKALAFHQKALNIQENVQCNPLECATTYINLGETYREMKGYSTALTYYQKGLEIRQKKLPKSHPNLAVVFHNMAKLYLSTRQYNMAIENVQQAIDIAQEKLPSNHRHLLEYKETFEEILKKM
ncbi:unnamed protein product [Rotaria sordida]|uniref:NAD(P)(+)--arginine ADP-ribosyltransferase n=2 Tax=Rotaria sordida TaxID=392033 RepID=A0A816AZ48_9BILA|nr:unnamed protein product [Rotaria sordida]CAF1603988.1 unnamed protein product [Rotaria sordida]